MIILFSKKFKKQFRKLPKRTQLRVGERIKLFTTDSQNPLLNNHKLQGKQSNYSSINISGDIRALYENLDKKKVLFVTIGTHSELYQ